MNYCRPSSLSQALALLAEPGTSPLAGGTVLLAERPADLHTVVDLQALGLDYLRREGDYFAAGAMLRLQSLVTSAELAGPALDILRDAARLAAPRPLRDMATIGGALVSGTGELLAALLALNAEVNMTNEEAWIALGEFLRGRDRHLPGRLIVGVRWPVPPATVGCGLARVARTPADRAIVAAVARIAREGDRVQTIHLALCGLTPVPHLIPLAAQEWNLDAVVESIRTTAQSVPVVSDFKASADYRREVAPVVARRALAEAWELAGGGR